MRIVLNDELNQLTSQLASQLARSRKTQCTMFYYIIVYGVKVHEKKKMKKKKSI